MSQSSNLKPQVDVLVKVDANLYVVSIHLQFQRNPQLTRWKIVHAMCIEMSDYPLQF